MSQPSRINGIIPLEISSKCGLQTMPRMKRKSSQSEGLRFGCVPGCTNCCDQKGYVYLTEKDLLNAAKFVGMTASAFESEYVYRTKHLLRLRKPPKSQCHFLREGGCSIHPVKPVQCRTFPFWPELVRSRKEWQQAGRYCPGIGTGELVQIGNALEIASEMEVAYPTIYES